MLLIDGVNEVLQAIGESSVPNGVDIDSLDEFHEAKQIRTMIQKESKATQKKGWWFNKESWVFLPDATTGRIVVPVTVIALVGTSATIAMRGNTMYDIANKTLLFDTDVTAMTTFELDFEETPEVFAELVILKTARKAQWLYKGDSAQDKKLEELVEEAKVDLEKEQFDNKSYNLIQGSRLIDRGSNPTALI